jgi:hypothetical protein
MRLRLGQRDERILDVFRRLEHSLAIQGECFGVSATGLRNLGVDLAKVEKAPPQGASSDRLEGLCREKTADTRAVEAERGRK